MATKKSTSRKSSPKRGGVKATVDNPEDKPGSGGAKGKGKKGKKGGKKKPNK